MAEKSKTEIPLTTIIAATNGDETALKDVVGYFRDYIRFLSRKTLKDEVGNEYIFVDEDKALQLEVKLICSIMNKFKILPA